MKLSIITVCLNSQDHIEACLTSVLSQSYADIQYIIIDGASTDQTLERIAPYREDIDVLISEPDEGIYDAMNKGLGLATGEVVYFLNSDDCLSDRQVIADVMQCFKNSKPELLCGNICYQKGTSSHIIKGPARISSVRLAYGTLPHQAVFAEKSLFDRIGDFDSSLQVVADYEWLLRALLGIRCRYFYFDRVIAVFSAEGLSNSVDFEQERKRVMHWYYSGISILMFRIVPLWLRRLKARLLLR